MASSRSKKRTTSKKRPTGRKRTGTSRSAPEKKTWFWDQLPDRTRHLIAIGAMVVIALAFFAPVNFGGKLVVGSDLVQWRSMAESMYEYRNTTGEEPLWATHLFSGMPGYMISYKNQIPQINLLPRLLREVAWPTFQFIFMMLGVYCLIYYLVRNQLAALFAACAFSLTTYMPIILSTGHSSKYFALSYIPWLMLAFIYTIRKPKLLSGLLFAVAFAAELRAGHVQMTYFAAFILGFWWVAEGITAFRSGSFNTFLKATMWLAAGTVLGAVMMADPYLLQTEYKDYTMRGAAPGGGEGGLAWDYAMAWSHKWSELWTLLIAYAYGGGGASYWGEKIFTEGPHYVGGLVIVLAVLATWKVRNRMVRAFALVTVLMMVFAVGENAPFLNRPMFDYFPLFSAFRAPEQWLAAVELVLAVLAGYGLYYLGRREADPQSEQQKTMSAYIAFGGVTAVVLLLWITQAGFSFEKPNELQLYAQRIAQQASQQQQQAVPPDHPQVQAQAQQMVTSLRAERADTFSADAMRTFIFLLLGGLSVFLYRTDRIPAWMMQGAMVLLLVVDLWGVGKRHFGPERLADREVEEQIPEYGFDQFVKQQVEAAGGDGHFRALSLEGNPTQVARPAFHYETSGGYHAAKLRIYQDFLDQLMFTQGTIIPSNRGLDLTGTRYVISPQPLPGLEVAYQDQQTGFFVLERPNVLPRAFFVGNAEVIPDHEAAWERLRDPNLNLRQTAVVAAELSESITPMDSTSVTSVQLESFGPRRIQWNVETDATRLMVISEVYYPAGWKAYVDDIETPIYQTNYAFRGVVVPSGAHTVRMVFEPANFTRGVWITGLSTLLVYGLVLGLLGYGWMNRRKEEAGA